MGAELEFLLKTLLFEEQNADLGVQGVFRADTTLRGPVLRTIGVRHQLPLTPPALSTTITSQGPSFPQF